MSTTFNPKPLTLLLCFLSLLALTSIACVMLYEGIVAEQWKAGCDGFPTAEEVEELLAERHELVQRLENVNPRPHQVFVEVSPCPGGAGIVIYYASESNRLEILKILDEVGATAEDEAPGTFFFGVPLRMRNN